MPHLPNGVIGLIVQYSAIYELDQYNFPRNVLKSPRLSENPNAIDYLQEHPDCINWSYLSANTRAGHMLRKLPSYLSVYGVCANPDAIDIIEEILEYKPEWRGREVSWESLSRNPAAMHILKSAKNERIYWPALSANPSDEAVDMLLKCPKLINWTQLSHNTNPRAIDLLSKNPEKIDWQYLSKNPAARRLLLENPQKINKTSMLANPAMIEMIKFWKNGNGCRNFYSDDNELDQLARNPAIFKLVGSVGIANALFALHW